MRTDKPKAGEYFDAYIATHDRHKTMGGPFLCTGRSTGNIVNAEELDGTKRIFTGGQWRFEKREGW